MLNKVMLIGRLGKDPEIRYTPGGDMVVNFSMATDESWTDKSGAKQEKTEWHRVTVFGKLAEICGKYLVKGKLIYIEGKLSTSSYEKNGEKRYSTGIIAGQMKMLDSKKEGSAPSEEHYVGYSPDGNVDDSDIPF